MLEISLYVLLCLFLLGMICYACYEGGIKDERKRLLKEIDRIRAQKHTNLYLDEIEKLIKKNAT